ncbi:MAG: NDP-sugar synthase [Isosphaeraceae bacterium]|nr:NDP-sugar synthase [Isosphaeraceae bacterium]
MRAVIFATGDQAVESDRPIADQLTAAMMPVVDRPMIQHVVEYLTRRGVRRIDIVLCHLAHEIESTLGDGSRWGIEIRHHLVRDPLYPYSILNLLRTSSTDREILIGHADTLPRLPLDPESNSAPMLLAAVEHGSEPEWTGWAWIESRPPIVTGDAIDRIAFERMIAARPGVQRRIVDLLLDVRSHDRLLRSNLAAMSRDDLGLMIAAPEVEPGIRIERNVSLHPTARVHSPIFVGEDSRIGEGVVLGPGTIIGSGCIVDKMSTLDHTLLFPRSYVGQGIELSHAIVVRRCLIDLRNGTEILLEDDLLLSNVETTAISTLARSLLSRACACGLLMVGLPFLVAAIVSRRLRGGASILESTEVVRLPSSDDPGRRRSFRLWRLTPSGSSGMRADFVERLLPGLVNVIRGRIRLVGVRPRNTNEIDRLPADWRRIYLASRAGLINEDPRAPQGEGSAEDRLISETYWAVSGDLRHDLVLVLHYFIAVLKNEEIVPRDGLFTEEGPTAARVSEAQPPQVDEDESESSSHPIVKPEDAHEVHRDRRSRLHRVGGRAAVYRGDDA